jgi:hypothetical protein
MNDLISYREPVPAVSSQRAQRIRHLVSTARGCIIEAGRELIAANEEIPRGEWSGWLRREFGWSPDTAHRYIVVANAFQNRDLRLDSDPPTITGEALELLAEEEVPQSVRDAAMDRAQTGETITKAEAQKMIAEATAKAIEAERQSWVDGFNAKEAEITALKEQIEKTSLTEATETLEELEQAYADACAERDELQARINDPTDDYIIQSVSRSTKRKPGRIMLMSIATALNRTITYDGREYAPAAEKDLAEMRRAKIEADEKLKQLHDPKGPPARWHRALQALRTLNSVDPVELLMQHRYDGFDHAFAQELPKAERWITQFAREMRDGNAATRTRDQSPVRHR